MSILAMTAAKTAAGGGDPPGFDPQTDITWHSLFWTEGTAFQAEGYSDANSVDTWPNETAESDATEATNQPSYDAAHTGYNDRPVVYFGATTSKKLITAAWSTNPTYPMSLVIIGNSDPTLSYLVLVDGRSTTDATRIAVQNGSSGSEWGIYAGAERKGGTRDSNAHLFVATFDGSTGSDSLYVDGTSVISGVDAGSGQHDGLTLGNYPGGGYPCLNLALVGVYEGTFTSDPAYADFVTWAEDHYGLTIA